MLFSTYPKSGDAPSTDAGFQDFSDSLLVVVIDLTYIVLWFLRERGFPGQDFRDESCLVFAFIFNRLIVAFEVGDRFEICPLSRELADNNLSIDML